MPSRRPDGCAVPTSELALVIQGFVDTWTRDHADLAALELGERGRASQRRFGGGARRNELGQLVGNDAVGAVTILHERTARVDPAGVGVPKTTIRAVLASRHRHTEFRIADALLAAAHTPEALHDGRVSVVPNPAATLESRTRCCGGSLNGSLGF